MSVLEQLISGKDRVQYLLENYPSLRDDDKKLWISYLVLFHNLQDVLIRPEPFEALCNLLLKDNVCSWETIRRLRQKLQEKGGYEKIGGDPTIQTLHRLRAKGKKVEGNKGKNRNFNLHSRVEVLLKNYSPLRDNDTQLWLAYLTMFHGMKERINGSIDAYEEFCDMILSKEVPTMESVRRARQLFQEKGLYTGEKRKQKITTNAEKVSNG